MAHPPSNRGNFGSINFYSSRTSSKLVELFDAHGVSFISVTQAFNTTTSMGRLTLNMLLSFAQFEREITGEQIRDKVAASKRKGIWMGGAVPLRGPQGGQLASLGQLHGRFGSGIENEF